MTNGEKPKDPHGDPKVVNPEFTAEISAVTRHLVGAQLGHKVRRVSTGEWQQVTDFGNFIIAPGGVYAYDDDEPAAAEVGDAIVEESLLSPIVRMTPQAPQPSVPPLTASTAPDHTLATQLRRERIITIVVLAIVGGAIVAFLITRF